MPVTSNKIPIAVERHSHLNLPFDHATTQHFMLLQPVYYRHTLKTENSHYKLTSLVNPMPMPVPTFGRIRHNLRHFFVPYRLVFPNWEEFVQDTIASNYDASSIVSNCPNISPEAIINLFVTPSYQTTTVVTSGEDFTYGGVKYKFTRLGRHFYKILYSLGYDLVGDDKDPFFNALALFAYAKVYSDWYANSQYLNSAYYLKLQRFFKFNKPNSNLALNDADLYDILMFIRPAVYKSNTYFEDAWDNPVAPNSGNFSQFAFADPTSSSGSYIATNPNGTPEMYQSNSANATLGTTYLHHALQKLAQYQKRHALSGARSIDRVLAEYGIQTAALKLQRSIYVGVSQSDININTIFATANGTNSLGSSVVGDKAGAALGSSNYEVQYQNDEEGIFLTISTIQPSGGYYQGYDRNNRHLTKSDFYNASFDALGVQSIEKGEVYVSKNVGTFAANAAAYAGHFGFTGRYGEYKRSISRVSGDLALPNVLQGGHCWHLMREFDDTYFNNSVANVSHDEDFCRGTDAERYDRIFTYTEYNLDPFYLFIHVDCSSYAPCHPLTDTFDWDSESERINIESNGPKVN